MTKKKAAQQMATQTSHFTFNPGTPSGARLRTGLDSTERGRVFLINELATMRASLLAPADGSTPDQFGKIVSDYGFSSPEDAQAAFNEIDAALIALDGIKVTLDQLFTRLR